MKKVKKTFTNHKAINDGIIDIYKKGGNTAEVEKYLKSIGREKNIRHDIFVANLQIKERAKEEREILVNTHVKRYEEMFDENISKTLDSHKHLRMHIRRYALIDNYVIAMDALVAKERVLGLHTRQFRMQMNNFFKKRIVAQYNFGQQKLEDLIRLKELLEKMKDNAQHYVEIPIDLEEEIKVANVIDIDHVEVNVDKVSKIKQEVKIKKQVIEEYSAETIENLKEKIFKEDLKKHDPKRKSFLDKLKKHD